MKIQKKIYSLAFIFFVRFNYAVQVRCNHAVQISCVKNDIAYPLYKEMVHYSQKYFPKVVATIITEYYSEAVSFFDLLDKYKKGICYSSYRDHEYKRDTEDDLHAASLTLGYCSYDKNNRSLNLHNRGSQKVLMDKFDAKMHESLKDNFLCYIAPLNNNSIIVSFDSYSVTRYDGGSYLIFPSLENNKIFIKNISDIHVQFFIQNNDNPQINLFHSAPKISFALRNQSAIMTRILFNKNQKNPNIESYYLPRQDQYCYKVKKYTNQKDLIFIFGTSRDKTNSNNQDKLYIIFTRFGYEPLCAEYPCDYITPSAIENECIIGMSNESHKDIMKEDYFILRSTDQIPACAVTIYTLQQCNEKFFQCFDV